MRRVHPTADGQYALDLSPDEREVLVSLAGQLRDLLTAGDRPEVRRLFPPGYPNDPDREAEYRLLVGSELLEQRFAAIDVLETTAQATLLSEDELSAWMASINALRLVLGTILDVSEDDTMIDPDDPDAPTWYAYHYLSGLLGEIVGALSGWDEGRARPR